MNIILCGLPMCGKTTCGRLAASRLGWSFIDTDLCVEEAYCQKEGRYLSCPQIFLLEGEASFRQQEKTQVAALRNVKESLIALGGGILCQENNQQLLQTIGTMIYLKTAPEEIWKRMQEKRVPVYLDRQNQEKAFYQLAEKRLPLYAAAARYTIEATGQEIEEIINKILSIVNGK